MWKDGEIPVVTLSGHTLCIVDENHAKCLFRFGFGTDYTRPVSHIPQSILVRLFLSKEEGLYLLENGRIIVLDETLNQINSPDILRKNNFCKDPLFDQKFFIYKKLMERGFFIRSGQNYGMDFTLYRRHPTECHSEVCIKLYLQRRWVDLFSLLRLLPEVMKLCVLFSPTEKLIVESVAVIARRHTVADNASTLEYYQNQYRKISSQKRKIPISDHLYKRRSTPLPCRVVSLK